MPTLVRDPQPAEFEALLARRRELGQDLFDEVWDGVLHMNPAPDSRHARVEWQLAAILAPLAAAAGLTPLGQFNLGRERDYRVPDGGLIQPGPDGVYVPTAAVVIEIVSPGDESYRKLDFYGSLGVDEVLIVDPAERVVHWFGLVDSRYEPIERSSLIDLGPDELNDRLEWPQD